MDTEYKLTPTKSGIFAFEDHFVPRDTLEKILAFSHKNSLAALVQYEPDGGGWFRLVFADVGPEATFQFLEFISTIPKPLFEVTTGERKFKGSLSELAKKNRWEIGAIGWEELSRLEVGKTCGGRFRGVNYYFTRIQ